MNKTKTLKAEHTPGPCGCITDSRKPGDWKILYCDTHASAPELLSVLKEFYDYEPNAMPKELEGKIKNVIAKAEGRA